jgi:hypothetical protein
MTECPVCLEEDLIFVSMKCKHEVCEVCLQKIMVNSKECPMCRMDLRPEARLELQPEPQPESQSVSCDKLTGACFMLTLISLILYGMTLRH